MNNPHEQADKFQCNDHSVQELLKRFESTISKFVATTVWAITVRSPNFGLSGVPVRVQVLFSMV